MHNCKLTRNVLLEYALGEESTSQAREALAGLDRCSSCQAEFAAIRNTLRVSRQALSSAAPADEFWPGYHARLKEKLVQQQEMLNDQVRVNIPITVPLGLRLLNGVRWFANASVRLPAPVAIAILLVVGFLTYNTLSLSRRANNATPTNATPTNIVAQGHSRIIEVPIVQERVVTRTVYLERKAPRSSSGLPVRADLTAAENRRGSATLNKTAMSLAGFKPTDEVKLTVIKGSYQDEK